MHILSSKSPFSPFLSIIPWPFFSAFLFPVFLFILYEKYNKLKNEHNSWLFLLCLLSFATFTGKICTNRLQPERLEVALLTVETEKTGDSKTTNDRGPSLVGSFFVGLVVQVREIFVLPWLL
jgi:hypothetical protein